MIFTDEQFTFFPVGRIKAQNINLSEELKVYERIKFIIMLFFKQRHFKQKAKKYNPTHIIAYIYIYIQLFHYTYKINRKHFFSTRLKNFKTYKNR